MKKKILFLCPYMFDKAPSQRLKFEQYYDCFREEYDITISHFIGERLWKIIYQDGNFLQKVGYSIWGYYRRLRDLLTIRRYDIVYVHLWVTPFGPPFFEWLICLFAKKVIYDIDDLVYLNASKSKAHPMVNLIKGYRKPIFLMKHADHVITCTPFLTEFVQKYNRRTTDIPVTMDTDRYQPITEYKDKECPVIGWSGSVTTSKYYHLLTEVFRRLQATRKFELWVMGDESVNIPGLNVKAVSWNKDEELLFMKGFDIGVYPLPDEPWVYGKGGGKAMQYMSLGIPTVATAVGPNYRVIDPGVCGYLVANEDEWVAVLSDLLDDHRLREQVGKMGRRKIENLYSVQVNKQQYLNIFRELTSGASESKSSPVGSRTF